MIAICHKCGSHKQNPMQKCIACHAVPQTDDDIALAFMLTDSLLDPNQLIKAAQMIRGGQRIELPQSLKASLLANLQGRRARQNIGAKGWGIIVAIAAILILIFHPWPHFQWAAYNDNLSSYDGFVARFPQSDYSAVANERIRVLRENEIWSTTDGSDQIETLRAYLRVYPDGKHLDEAKQQTTHIADNQWIPISKSRSEAEISHYLEDFPETSKRAAVEVRIQELYNDIDWVKEQDTLEHYRRFATRFPTHSQSRAIDKRIIDLEVKEIAAGEYGEMPRAQALSQGGTSTNVEVENQTGYELTVRYSGPDSKKLVIPVGASRSIKLVPGAYQVAASVEAANVTNYYGSDTMQGGRYSSNFYIE